MSDAIVQHVRTREIRPPNSRELFFENGIYRLLTVSDVAGILRCSAGTVRNWVYRGLIPTVRPMPRMVRVDPRELWNWLSERKEFR